MRRIVLLCAGIWLCAFMFAQVEMQTMLRFASPVKDCWDSSDDLSCKIFGDGDLNGDGYNDMVISGRALADPQWHTKLFIYLGSATPDTVADYIISDPSEPVGGTLFGSPITYNNDLNGDGIDDLVVGATSAGCDNEGWVYIYFGAAQLHTTPDVTLEGYDYSVDLFGTGINTSGDFNGDGYKDLVIGSAGPCMAFNGQIDILWGGPDFDAVADWHFQGEMLEWFGRSMAVGDLNGEGFADLAVSSAVDSLEQTFVKVFRGGPDMETVPGLIQEAPSYYTYVAAMEGDLDNDGFADLVLGGSDLFIKYGSADLAGEFIPLPLVGRPGNERACFYSHFEDSDYLTVTKPLDSVIYSFSSDAEHNVSIAYIVNSEYNIHALGEQDYFLGDFNGDGHSEIVITEHPDSVWYFRVYSTHPVAAEDPVLPVNMLRAVCYPNPTTSSSTLAFGLPQRQRVSVNLYNCKGQRVRVLSSKSDFRAGKHQLYWDGRDENRKKCASGLYYMRIEGEKNSLTKKIIVFKM